MDDLAVVTELWDRIAARDWPGFGRLLADDVVLELPASGEVVRGRANVVAVNAEYPDGWSIEMLHVVGAGDQVASEVEVPLVGTGVFRAASFWTSAKAGSSTCGSTGRCSGPTRLLPGGSSTPERP